MARDALTLYDEWMYSSENHCKTPRLAGQLFVVVVLSLLTGLAWSSSPQPIDLILKEESLPGIAWATLDDNTLLSGASGYADVTTAKPMTANTKVQVGSVTKILVALGVLHLISQGQLSLDTEVEQLLPTLNWNNPWRDHAPITVEHLLEHTAGLDNLRMWQFLNSKVSADAPLATAFPQNHDHLLRLRTRPGSQYSYSNMGYALLGLVIEEVTLERYEAYLDRELLKPLGMQDSSFFLVTQDQDSRLAMGYLDVGIPQKSVPMLLRPAGQFTTTAADMQALLRFLLGSGQLNGEDFIASRYMNRLGTPATTDAYLAGLSMGHGLALAARDRHGVLGECHPGETFGFRARLCLFPRQGKAFFYAINADHESSDYERFVEHFIERVDVEPITEAPIVQRADLKDFTGLYILAPSNMAQFAWLDWLFNSIWLSVDLEGKGLLVDALQAQQRLLLPLEGALFRDAERRTASHVFMGDHNTFLSNGLMTWRRASLLQLGLGWVSLVGGLVGLLYIFLRGFWLMLPGASIAKSGILPPWLCLVAFAIPAYLYKGQPYLQFGEVTGASLLLAALTGLLPLSLVFALYRLTQSPGRSVPEFLAVVASLQLCLVLLFQNVLPFMFWR